MFPAYRIYNAQVILAITAGLLIHLVANTT